MEIEKKFLVKEVPFDLNQYEKAEIEQGYLCTNPVVRIRKWNEDYILTYKSRQGVENVAGVCACVEEELPLTKEAFAHLMGKIDGFMICKTRYLIPLDGGLKVELDCFHNQYEGILVAEIEFPSVEMAQSFVAPSWLGKNVSDDRRYSNNSMSQKILVDL